MHKIDFRLFLLVPLLSVSLTTSAQSDGTFLTRAISNLGQQPVQEKVYLHLDKQAYDFGDTIWYKAYTVIGQHHQLSALSGVLYVELISPKDSLVTRQIVPLVSGVGWSDIPLPHTLPQGSYRLRAYTNWMRNDGPEYFYNGRVQIGGVAPVSHAARQAGKPDVQFFPEGGELVNGVRSRVAVKSVNAKGIGEDINGTIEDNEGNVVADFATQHLGMGVFAFIPQSGKTYRAKISVNGEAGFNVDIPKAHDEGYTLTLNNSRPDSLFIKIAVNEKTLTDQKNNTFYIIGQNSGKVYYSSEGKLDGLVYTAKVEKKRFPTGIAQFTLFSQNGEPTAERIVFIQGNDILNLSINAPPTTYAERQQVKIDLEVKDGDNKPVAGSFSASVINESLVRPDENAESTILNNLLLTSDLKGNIEQPNYYFANTNEQTNADLDVLMLTQGYRRYEWKKMLADTAHKITYLPEKSLTLSGTLKTPAGKPVPNGKVTLAATKENLLRDTTTDANGNFTFTGLVLVDTAQIVLKARKENKNDNVVVTVQQPVYPAILPTTIYGSAVNQSEPGTVTVMQERYNNYQKEQRLSKKTIQLRQVNIRGNKQPKAPDLSNSASIHPGGADQVIMGDKLDGCITLSDCLIGKIFGVNFKQTGAPFNTRGGNMSIIVDGNILDGLNLNELNANDIYSIEVLRSGAAKTIYGTSIQQGGALVITMKHGGEDSRRVTPKPLSGLITYPFSGFYKAKTFYLPKYTGPKTNAQQPDERTTIYWNPNIITNKEGTAAIDYFNADIKGTYRVVVEGIDDNGNLGRVVIRYKVE